MDIERKLTIYLVRHAQCKGNTVWSQNADGDMLTERGKVEANLLGMHLSPVKFDCVYSSDYTRARQTAEAIIKQSKLSNSIPVTLDKRLREVNSGIYAQSSYKEVMDYSLSLKVPPLEWYYPEGESLPQTGKRMLNTIEEICEKYLHSNNNDNPLSNAIVVSHSGAIIAFMDILSKSNHELVNWNPKDLKFMKNANYIKFEIKKGQSDFPVDADCKPKWQFSVLENHYCKHLDCISEGTGLHPMFQFTKDKGEKFKGCVQQ